MPTNSRPNYYVLLGLNPDERWDQVRFETILKSKQRQWGMESTGIGPKAENAKFSISLLSEIQRVMSDPVERENEANEARKELADQKKERLEKFEQQLPAAQSKGYLEEAEFKGLVKDFADVLTEPEIRKRVTVPIQSASSGSRKPDQLDVSVAKEIAQKLSQLHLQSLYELLGKPLTHSRADLRTLANQLYLDMVKRPPGPENTLKMELAGQAIKVFDSDVMRAKYDATLHQAEIDVLLQDLGEIVNRTTSKEVHEKQVETFLDRAGKIGWGKIEALAELKTWAQKRKWTLIAPAPPTTPQQRCGFCTQINDMPRKFCRKCNRELNLDCPNCGQPVVADAVGCGHCGFRVGDRFWVDDSIAHCHQLIAKKNVAEAQQLLTELEAAWKPLKTDPRLESIKDCRASLNALVKRAERSAEEQRKNQQQIKDILERFIKERKLYEARQFLSAQPSTMPDRGSYQRRIDTALAEAQKLLAPARAVSSSYDDRVASCEQALALCVDYQEARDLLKTLPPPAPQGLQANVKDTIVTLFWKAPSTKAMNYRIVRKKQSHPSSAQDGEVLKTVSGLLYDDPVPDGAIGVPLYYAIYAEYGGAISSHAAVLAHPVFLIQEVTQLSAQVDHDLVELHWQPPLNVYKVIVLRKEKQAPGSFTDPDATLVGEYNKNLHRLLDRGVIDGKTYYYTFYSQFRDHQGNIKTSRGANISVVPEAPPEPPGKLDLNEADQGVHNGIRIGWKRPRKGEMIVIKSAQPLQPAGGRILHESDLGQYGTRLDSRTTTLIDTWQQVGIIYYTPAILLQQMAYLGESQRYVCVENVRDLRTETIDTNMAIRLYWSWPERCDRVIVYSSSLSWPLVDDPTPSASSVSRTNYEHIGYYDLSGKANQNYYIVVASVMQIGKEQVTSQGVRTEAMLVKKTQVNYEINQSGLFRKNRTLRITMQMHGSLPALWLVSKQGGLPFRKEDGETILRVQPLLVQEREVVIDVPGRYPPGTFVKLFLEDDEMNEIVKILHPALQKLRLD